MKHSFSWEANSCSATQAIPNILWNQNVHNHADRSLPLVCTLSNINQVNTLHYISLRTNLILYTRVRLGFASGFFRSGLSMIITMTLLLCTMHSTCPTDLIIIRICEMSYPPWSSSLCNLNAFYYVVLPNSSYSPHHPAV
jgi:hypothetical protein